MAARTESDISSTTSSPGHRLDTIDQESRVKRNGHLFARVVSVDIVLHVAGVMALRTDLEVAILHREANRRRRVLGEELRALERGQQGVFAMRSWLGKLAGMSCKTEG